MSKLWFGAVGLAATALATGVVACSSGFGSEGCEASHTCSSAAGDPNDGGAAGSKSSHPSGGVGGQQPPDTAAGAPDVGGRSGASNDGGAESAGEGGASGAGALPNNPAPYVTAVTPADESEEVDPDGEITITFSEALAPKTVNASSIKLLDGDREVDGAIVYADSTVTFTPAEPLALLATYTLSVSSAVTDLEGESLETEFQSTFVVRDGKFTTADAATSPVYELADTLSTNAHGDVLLAWTDAGNGQYCPPYAQWFNRGESLAPAKPLAAPGETECYWISAAANAAGVAGVAWQTVDAQRSTYLPQYRGGNWASGDGKMSTGLTSYHLRVAVAPSGMISLFEDGISSARVYRTDSAGNWAAQPDTLSNSTAMLAAPEVAFDGAGNGLAVWRAKTAADIEEILTSRYTPGSGQWSTATVLPGSQASASGTSHERGVPALAMDSAGNAVVLWVNTKDAGVEAPLMANTFSTESGWASAVEVAASVVVQPTYDAPGLVFDGSTFVAAFTASNGTRLLTYTARYDAEKKKWDELEYRQSAPEADAVARMPQLAGDARGNLLLVWVTGTSPRFKLMYQRYANGTWSSTSAVPAATLNDEYFGTYHRPFPLVVSENGTGALAWGIYEGGERPNGIRLASFY